MNISVVGSGYVGLVSATCFAELGNNVTCIDVIKEKVDAINAGKTPIYEEGLEGMLQRNLSAGRLKATLDFQDAVKNSDVTFICVGTPSSDDGSTDLKYIESAANSIGKALKEKNAYHVVVVKSTVPPGTTEKAASIIERESGKKLGGGFGACMNPEFLKEGAAVKDFMEPDRVVIGASDEKAAGVLEELYSPFKEKTSFLKTNTKTAEMIKYASNAFLATKVSFINEIANMCEKLGIDVYDVADGMGFDKRINRYFLNAGAGWGGSCFGKDVKSLVHTSKQAGYEPQILGATIRVNELQPLKLVEIAESELGDLKEKRVALLGLAFKPGTDDMRDAPSIKVINALLEKGASVTAYDPKAAENAEKIFSGRIAYTSSALKALEGADACIIITEWPEFKQITAEDYKKMKNPLVIEGRRVLGEHEMSGVKYRGIGRGEHA